MLNIIHAEDFSLLKIKIKMAETVQKKLASEIEKFNGFQKGKNMEC